MPVSPRAWPCACPRPQPMRGRPPWIPTAGWKGSRPRRHWTGGVPRTPAPRPPWLPRRRSANSRPSCWRSTIPSIYKMCDWYYNFWRDKQDPRGVWRRTTLEEYRKPQPKWETVLDLDALNRAEGLTGDRQWVWHGAECLRPDYTRCLVALSRGG